MNDIRDMADAGATSGTPNSRDGLALLKKRRSWTAVKQVKFEVAVEMSKPEFENQENDVHHLELTYFSTPPKIDFGRIRVGKTATRILIIHNPHECEQEVIVEKFPTKKKFSVDLVEFTVEPDDYVHLTLSWRPDDTCRCRELVIFRVADAYRLQAILLGQAEHPPKPRKRRGLSALCKKKWNPGSTIMLERNVQSVLQEKSTNLTNRDTEQKLSKALKKETSPCRTKTSHSQQSVNVSSHLRLKCTNVTQPHMTVQSPESPVFKENESRLPDTPVRRMTFIKNHPDLPVTPVRRDTFIRNPITHNSQNQMSADLAPIMQWPGSLEHHAVTSTPTTPGSLRRSLTYTKLNVSNSPEMKDNEPASETGDTSEPVSQISPASSQYFTPLSTPLDSPHDSDSDDVMFQDSVMYLPGEEPVTPDPGHVTVIEADLGEAPKRSYVGEVRDVDQVVDYSNVVDKCEMDMEVQHTTIEVVHEVWESNGVQSQLADCCSVDTLSTDNWMASQKRILNQTTKEEQFTSVVTSTHALSSDQAVGSPTDEPTWTKDVCSVRDSLDAWLKDSFEYQHDVSPPSHLATISQCNTLSTELHQRLSSTPVPGVQRKHSSGKDVLCSLEAATLMLTKTPSPILGQRASSETVVKSKSSVTQNVTEVDMKVNDSALDLGKKQFKCCLFKKNSVQGMAGEAALITNQQRHTESYEEKTDSCSQNEDDSSSIIAQSPHHHGSHLGVPFIVKSRNQSVKKRPLSTDRQSALARLCAPTESSSKRAKSRHGIAINKTTVSVLDSVKTKIDYNTKPTKAMQLRRQAALSSMKTSELRPAAHRDPKSSSARKKAHVGKPVKGLAQSKLVLICRNKTTALTKHPMPFAAKNVYYDERWMEKEERAFTVWLNFVLTPPEYLMTSANKRPKVDAGKLCLSSTFEGIKRAPTKEAISFKLYSARCHMNRLRQAACRLYQSQSFVKVIRKLEREVCLGRILIRKDRKIHADLGMRQKLLDMLLCYNPLWLRLGLETVYGEVIPMQSNSDVLTLSRFIINRLLANPDIAEQYAHPTVPHLYRDGYDEAIAQFILKKFLLVVYLLDMAKRSRLIEHDPCLFCKEAEFKASRDLLLAFSRDYLAGEGDLTRHLSYFGYQVSHRQTYLEEFDFSVSNLAIDLRCGLRLSRVMEILTQSWTLSTQLRVPAISRLQKIHNVNLALKSLTQKGLNLSAETIQAKDIVDGHREKTLGLLWLIIYHYQINVLIDESHLQEEINFLIKSLSYKRQLKSLLEEVESHEAPDRRMSLDPDMYIKSRHLFLLLKWCRVVCAHYALKINNFTVSFCDGRALCYLLHHYHPSLLPLEKIRTETTLTYLNFSDEDRNSPGNVDSDVFKHLLANEKENFHLLYEGLKELGGVPVMIRLSDMSNTIPDEKAVITFVSYLCARLLDLSKEVRAARKIQVAWRQYWFQRQRQLIEDQQAHQYLEAVTKIQAFWRGYMTRKYVRKCHQAAMVIQRHYRAIRLGKIQHKEYKQQRQATVIIQRIVRRHLTKIHREQATRIRQTELTEDAIVRLQSAIRGWMARRRFMRMCAATLVIQSHYRSYLSTKKTQHEYQSMRRSVICIQSRWRAYRQRKEYLELRQSAITLQSHVRRHRQQKKYKAIRQAAITIQRRWRVKLMSKKVREQYERTRLAVVTIQSWLKMVRERRSYLELRNAVVLVQTRFRARVAGKKQRFEFCRLRNAVILMQRLHREKLTARHQKYVAAALIVQTWYRCVRERRKYLALRSAVMTMQKHYRGRQLARRQLLQYHMIRGAVITVQSWVRRFLVQHRLLRMHAAATIIQCAVRRHQAIRLVTRKRAAAVCIQRWWRSAKRARQVRSEYLNTRCKLIRLQSTIRMYLTRRRFLVTKRAAVMIQTSWRTILARREYTDRMKGIITLQSAIRGWMARRRFMRMCAATLVIQSHYRSYLSTKKTQHEYQSMRRSVICIQSRWRAYRQRKEYLELRQSAITLQSHVRRHRQQKKYKAIRQAAITIQRRWKVKLMSKKVREQYERTRLAVVTIQSWLKMVRERRSYLELRNAVVLVQTRFRARVAGKKQRFEFCRLRNAVILMQRLHREKLTARHLKYVAAALIVQTWYRCVRERRKYLALRSAVMTMQKHYRGRQLARRQLLQYHMIRGAVITVQSWVRRFLVQHRLLRMHAAATIIQCAVRRHQAIRLVTRKRAAAVCIQRWWRSAKRARQVRSEYLNTRCKLIRLQSTIRMYLTRRRFLVTKRAAVMIQTSWRTILARREYTDRMKGIITLQSAIRGWMARRRFMRMCAATLVIQSHYRSYLSTKKTQHEYQSMRRSVICIQSRWRAYRQRKEYLELRQSAITLQSHVRRHRQQKKYKAIRQAAITIQRRWKVKLMSKKVREQYERTRQAVVTIQSWLKMVRERRSYLELRNAVVLVQTRFRARVAGKKQRFEFCRLRNAVILMQRLHREKLTARHLKYVAAALIVQTWYRCVRERRKYLALRSAVMTMQKHYRGRQLARRQLLQYHMIRGAVITVQSWVRRFLVQHRLLRMHAAATIIQCAVRRHQAIRLVTRKRAAAVCIQRWWRSAKRARQVRSEYLNTRCKLIRLQSTIRMYLTRRRFLITKRAAVMIQTSWRTILARREYTDRMKGIITLQSAIRGWMARRRFMRMWAATLVIQSHYRSYLSTKKTQHEYQSMRRSVICIQSRWRAYRQRKEYLELRQSAITLQSHVRRHRQQKKYKAIRQAAITIQRRWKVKLMSKKVREQYERTRLAVVTIQSWLKMVRERRSYLELRNAVVLVQTRWRATQEMRRCSMRFSDMRRAALTLQRAYRHFSETRRCLKRIQAAVIIQRQWRMKRTLRLYRTRWKAAVCIQSHVRRFLVRRTMTKRHQAACVIQQRYRAVVMMRHQQTDYHVMLGAAITIQAVYKGYRQRRAYNKMHRGFVELQAVVKGRIQRASFRRLRAAALLCQHRVRTRQLARRVRGEYIRSRMAAIRIQTAFRMWSAQNRYLRMRWLVLKLQAMWRGLKARRSYHRKKLAILCIQSRFRSMLAGQRARSSYLLQRQAAICLQSYYRTYRQRCLYVRQRDRVRHLQILCRGWLARQHKAAICIQMAYRAYVKHKQTKLIQQKRAVYLESYVRVTHICLAAIRIQRTWRRQQQMKNAKNNLDALITLQRWFRAKLQRLRYLRLVNSLSSVQRSALAYLARRQVAALTLQKTARVILERRQKKRRQTAAVTIQSLWRGYKLRKQTEDKNIVKARKKLRQANANATKDKTLAHRTRSALDYLLRCKQLSLVLEAVRDLDVATQLSSRCCEWLVEENAQVVLYKLIRCCNRSVPHMEIVNHTVRILLNLVKYDKTRAVVYEVQDSVQTLVDLMAIYREKGPIFTNTCILFGILCDDPDRRKDILSMPKIVSKLSSIHAILVHKHKLKEQRAMVESKMAQSRQYFSLYPEWCIQKNKSCYSSDPLQDISFVLKNLHLIDN